MKLRFAPEWKARLLNPLSTDHPEPCTTRNCDYQVYLGKQKIGNLMARFHADRRHRTWEFPILFAQDRCGMDIMIATNLDLPLHQMKCLIRYILLESPDFSHFTELQIRKLARSLHNQQTHKTREIAARRVKFKPFPNHGFFRNFQILFDGECISSLHIDYLTFEGSPRWIFDHHLLNYLQTNERISIELPFNHCKALLRHIIGNSISIHRLRTNEVHEMADFAREQELQSNALKQKNQGFQPYNSEYTP